MSSLLRGAEVDACIHRIALARAGSLSIATVATTPEQERRRRDAELHRESVERALREHHPNAIVSTGRTRTRELLIDGCEVILQPRLIDHDEARRSASVQALIRVGRVDDAYTYAPIVVKNHEVIESASTRRLHEGHLEQLLPTDAVARDGVGLRSTPTVRRDGLLLSAATRILQSLGHGDPSTRGGVVDRSQRLWWIDLGGSGHPRCNLTAYDELYGERIDVLRRLDEWQREGGDFPTSPYWHRECLTCEFSEHCERELDDIDDVSLTRFTTQEQQRSLRHAGIQTRSALARLDPVRARQARAGQPGDNPEDLLGRSIDKLDDLIYRARAHVRASNLRILDAEQMGCPIADVEVDVDMESFNDVTYLWGAYVTHHGDTAEIDVGYHAFVDWSPLDAMTEARVFASFWRWFDGLRHQCEDHGLTFAAYCFWAHAEDGAMDRAVLTHVEGGPDSSDLERFRRHEPPQWHDLHDIAKRQIQTEGPLGLKQLATATGFAWRDPNPSGEASMLWYEKAVGDGDDVSLHRRRLLEYNEDDCRATKALRDWLNGPAQALAQRDDFV